MIFRRTIGFLVAQTYRLTGGRRRALSDLRRPERILPIVFHAAAPDEVRAVLRWLRGAGVLDRVELTFDDGWCTFGATIPVLEEFGVTATVFIAPEETVRGRVWTDGTTIAQRRELYGVSVETRYKRLAAWGIGTDRQLMTEREVRELARHPLVRIGNHTWSHVSCTDRPFEEVMAEVRRAQDILTDWCGYPPTDFAYPFGRGTARLDAAIREMGLVPHTLHPGFVTRATRGAARNLFCEGMTLSENIGRLLGAWPKIGVTL